MRPNRPLAIGEPTNGASQIFGYVGGADPRQALEAEHADIRVSARGAPEADREIGDVAADSTSAAVGRQHREVEQRGGQGLFRFTTVRARQCDEREGRGPACSPLAAGAGVDPAGAAAAPPWVSSI